MLSLGVDISGDGNDDLVETLLDLTFYENKELVSAALELVCQSIPNPPPKRKLLSGFLEIANERMADAVRKISIREGYDPTDYALVAFGGAGGQHACAIAEKLVITPFLGPADAVMLSARGLREAVMERFAERQILQPLESFGQALGSTFEELTNEALGALKKEGFAADEITVRRRFVSL